MSGYRSRPLQRFSPSSLRLDPPKTVSPRVFHLFFFFLFTVWFLISSNWKRDRWNEGWLRVRRERFHACIGNNFSCVCCKLKHFCRYIRNVWTSLCWLQFLVFHAQILQFLLRFFDYSSASSILILLVLCLWKIIRKLSKEIVISYERITYVWYIELIRSISYSRSFLFHVYFRCIFRSLLWYL